MPKLIQHLGDLTPDPQNARLHNPRNIGMIEDALHEVGAARSIVVDEDGVVLAGNGLIEAAAAAGIERVQVVDADGETIVAVRRSNLTEDQKRRLALFDNRAAELAEWDTRVLAGLVEAQPEAVKGMWGDEELAALLEVGRPLPEPTADPGAQMDRAEELRQQWGTERGQLWEIPSRSVPGKCHRLLCGDSTSAEDVARLMAGERAALVITSPPYGVGKDYESGDLEDWRNLMRGWVSVWSQHVALAAVNLADVRCGPDSREVHTYGEFAVMATSAGWPLIGTRIWSKPPAWGNPFYAHSYRAVDDWEYIGLFGGSPYQTRVEDDWRFRGVWEMASVSANNDHSAKFPVELPSRLQRLLSDPGSVIAEPFTGSGTTMVAAEQTGRLCYGMEIEPKYVAVALQRLADMGLEPRLADSNPKGMQQPHGEG